MNERNDTIYAGIYYTEGNGNSPQFVYSFEGVSFTGSQSPTNVSNLTFSKYFEVDFLMAGNCNTSSVNQHLHECPETRLCQCPCSPVKNGSNYTVDELHDLLLSSLKKLEKELKVDKKLLSSYVRKHVSASDERLSSRSLGIGGIVCLCLMAAAILGMDLMSIKRHTATAKGICIGRP
ncbi:uncharacterized protein LOC127728265 [Mytilus californianus]|uniref:uncharacterized protein LOC127728265 n=1 Tax=Mytilus californianus TaxID=6549 RepID=UPI002245976B|nr:uncharacterized protein LOC127728265 [Mytilus californianus]